jgi:serine/threonine protein kinase
VDITGSSNILGSGEFAIVVAGRWKTKDNMNIAVKIPKPTNEVERFKAVLSEVKIMIYMGHAQNVVNLLGVCTQHIKNRKIHIILEFCENGSLLHFLRTNQSNFINLLDSTNIEADWDDETSSSLNAVTTMDLIRWSGEVANGMTHLAIKGVGSYIICSWFLPGNTSLINVNLVNLIIDRSC